MKDRFLLKKIYNHLDKKQIALIIGARQVGKTTLLKELNEILNQENQEVYYLTLENPDIVAKTQGWHPFYESVLDNPYLNDFYGDMKRWSFNLQIYFLHHRFRNHVKMSQQNKGVIQDRTIYEDVEIFAKNLHLLGNIDDRDWENYRNLFEVMISFLRKPDMLIYLKASTDTLLTRIRKRARSYEKSIDPEYLHTLNVSYDKWIAGIKDIPILTVDTDHFNIFEDQNKLSSIIENINIKLS